MVGDEQDFKISYETLFDILKRERDRPDLQKLKKSFLNEVADFVKTKEQELRNCSENERENLQRQIVNIRRILIDLYSKREKKINNLALDKSRSKSVIIDQETLLREETKLFDSLILIFDEYRESVLNSILKGQNPNFNKKVSNENNNKLTQDDEENVKKDDGTKLVRFIHAVPKFVGKELEEYGPFEEEDIANLPTEIANLLISKGRVEHINKQ